MLRHVPGRPGSTCPGPGAGTAPGNHAGRPRGLPANNQATPHVDALRASTPHSLQSRRFPEFGYQASPVGREEVSHPQLNTLPHTRSARTEDSDSMETHMGSARSTLPHIESARTGDEEEIGETRNTLPHTSSAHTGEQLLFRDTRTRDPDDAFGDTRTRDQDDVRDTRTLQITRATPYRFHASHQARKFRHLMAQIRPSSVLGLFNLKLLRAIRAGQQGNR